MSENKKEDLIKVEVHYIAAGKPFKKDAQSSETGGQVKEQALVFFGLSEGGGKTYKIFYDRVELQNMNETLDQLAGGKKNIKLDLEEVLVQG